MLTVLSTVSGLRLWVHRPPSMGRKGYGYGTMVTTHGWLGLWIWDVGAVLMVTIYGMGL